MLTRLCQTAAYRPGKISEALTERAKEPSRSAQNRPGVPEASDSQLAEYQKPDGRRQ